MKVFANKDKKDEKKSSGITELSEDQKQANLAAGLNEDGSPKTMELSDDQKKAHLAAGLNEDGSPKTSTDNKSQNPFAAAGLNEDGTIKEGEYKPDEFVIKEMMLQKGISREEAIKRLKNPN